jgi:hypothetical protein
VGRVIVPKLHGAWAVGAMSTAAIAFLISTHVSIAWHITTLMICIWILTQFSITKLSPSFPPKPDADDNYQATSFKQFKFKDDEIIIPEETISNIIETHCNKEDGVRNLKRCLEIIHTKLNLYRLMKPGSNLFEQDMSLKVQFPFTITKEVVDKLIKREKDFVSLALYSMYV